MAKSKCYLCNKRLKGGEGMLMKFSDGIHKVCVDNRQCRIRRMQNSIQVPQYDTEKQNEKAEQDTDDHALHMMKIVCLSLFGLSIILSVLLVVGL